MCTCIQDILDNIKKLPEVHEPHRSHEKNFLAVNRLEQKL